MIVMLMDALRSLKIWTVVQIMIYCAIVWFALDFTRYFAGREAAWCLGIAILLVAIVFMFKQRKKI